MNSRHYLDHASTSPLRPEARSAIVEWATSDLVGDPGRVYAEGRAVRDAVEDSRDSLAELIGARPREVVFTASGTEAVNMACFGVRASGTRSASMIAAAVEHSAVRRAVACAGSGAELAVDGLGRVDLDQLDRLLAVSDGDLPILVHCQFANHEVGTIQPVVELVARCRTRGVPVHVDACAAVGQLSIDVAALGADFVSLSGHKFGAPPGVGALFVRRGLRIAPLLVGGEQERARRAGMENVPGIVAIGAVARHLAAGGLLAEEQRAREQTERIVAGACAVPGVRRFGDPMMHLPHLACLSVEGVEAEGVVLGLDQAGIAVHSGSACSSESFEPSPVLAAMGVDAENSIRISVGWSTTDEDVDAFLAHFAPTVQRLRALHD